jgi:glycosyltransferase involved in cell wall biosynthesis
VNILHVIIGLEAGGAEHVLRRLVESHRGSRQFRHSIVSLTECGKLGEQLRAEGVDVRALGMRSLLGAPRVALRLSRMMRAQRPDIVQAWMYHADLMGGLAAKSVGIKNIIWGIRSADMIQGTAYTTFVIRRICALLSHWLPARIICAAEAARIAHEAIGYDTSKMLVIPNGFDVPAIECLGQLRQNMRAQCGWKGDEFVIGCVGRFNYYKDHANFVEAAGILAASNPAARFLMIGKGLDPANDELRALILRTGVADRFQLLGFRADVSNWLAAMDVFCLSSRSEGFPNVVGEAMSIGIPVVSTDVGDVRVLMGDTGHIVPKENAAALSAALAEVMAAAPATTRDSGQRGRQRIVQEFSMTQTRERFESVYTSLSCVE